MSPASATGAGGRRVVTIKSMSCRGVRAFVPFQKPPLYAAVSLAGRREKTPPDADGGENPDWEGAVVAFDLDGNEQQELVQFEVKAQVPLLGNKLVGTASVPVADLAPAAGGGGGDGATALRHVSYQVRAPDGKPNGTLSFAYAVSGGGASPQQPQLSSVPDPQLEPKPTLSSCAPPPVITAYPAPSTANFAPHSGVGYPPTPSPAASGSLYPPLHDLLTSSSTYPPPPPPSSTLSRPSVTSHHFVPEPNSSTYPPPDSVYPPPAPNSSVYPAPPDSCASRPAHYISSYTPHPHPPSPSSYPPPPPSGCPPPASNLAPPTGPYPPPDSGSVYPPPPRSSVDRELQHYAAPSSTHTSPAGASYYPTPPEVDGGGERTPYYYPPPPGLRYP